jgi:hypothetical protein
MQLQKLGCYIGLFCILLGLSAAIAYQTLSLAEMADSFQSPFRSFLRGIETYRDFKVAWRPRLLANFLAAKVAQFGGLNLKKTIPIWSAGWFFLTGLLYIIVAKQKALFYLFGLLAAILFGYTPKLKRVFPWDLPIVFVFALFSILFARKKYLWILLLLPIGMSIKETTILLCLGFLFAELPLQRRVAFFGISLVSCIIVKTAIDFYVQVPLPFFTMEYSFSTGSLEFLYLLHNLEKIISLRFVPLMVNSGTFLAFLLMPALDKTARVFKIIGVTFLGFALLFGLINEYRIFFEMIPLALYSLSLYFYGDSFFTMKPNVQRAD